MLRIKRLVRPETHRMQSGNRGHYSRTCKRLCRLGGAGSDNDSGLYANEFKRENVEVKAIETQSQDQKKL